MIESRGGEMMVKISWWVGKSRVRGQLSIRREDLIVAASITGSSEASTGTIKEKGLVGCNFKPRYPGSSRDGDVLRCC